MLARTILLMSLLLGFGLAQPSTAQVAANDSVVLGQDYENAAFYSFADGVVRQTPRKNWQLAFGISQSSTIRFNGGALIEVYKLPYDTGEWSSVDTAGNLTADNRLHDPDTSWAPGGFNLTNDPGDWQDIGWGNYNPATHVVTGDSLYAVKWPNGNVRKLWIIKRASGKYYVRHAKLDGSQQITDTIDTDNFSNRYFAYYDLTGGGTVRDREPDNSSWDLLFTKYEKPIPMGPGQTAYYSVSGVKSNAGVKIAEQTGVAPSTTDTSGLSYSDHTNTIGSDWKSFTGMDFELQDSLVYFVKTLDGGLWKLVFTAFSGQSEGKFVFHKQSLKTSSRAAAAQQAGRLAEVYPNPAQRQVTIAYELKRRAPGLQAELLDLQGRRVYRTQLPASPGLHQVQARSLDELAPGVYHLRIRGEGFSAHRKLLVR
jgi:hypothetical protein